MKESGWNDYFSTQFEPWRARGCAAARVGVSQRGQYIVCTAEGEIEARLSGRFLHEALAPADFPVAGDWVALRGGRIEAVLPRRTKLSRKQPGGANQEQVLAANIDVLFIVCGLDGDFSPRRIERYLVLAAESGAEPVVVLNKADLCAGAGERIAATEALGAPVIAISALEGRGMQQMAAFMERGRTAALIGSSGVGKSTIVNALLRSEVQRTREVHGHDSRGRHTTTHRELILMPGGWLLLDMPGLREVQLWTDQPGLDTVFDDIAALAAGCRFRDCRHRGEPGCAVWLAVDERRLDESRLAAYDKLQREVAHLEARLDERVAAERKREIKRIHKAARKLGNSW